MSAKAKTRTKPALTVDLGLLDKAVEGIDLSANDITLTALRRVQEVYGYIPEEALFELARRMRVTPAHLYGVATFYDQFTFEPKGRNVIRLCTNVACGILGAEELAETLGGELGVGTGGTTKDGRFTLLEVECIGACGKGPAMMVNDDFHYNLTEEGVRKVLARYK